MEICTDSCTEDDALLSDDVWSDLIEHPWRQQKFCVGNCTTNPEAENDTTKHTVNFY